MAAKMHKIFKHSPFFLIISSFLAISFWSCDNNATESERTMTIRLLADETGKDWMASQYFIDGDERLLKGCDSTYVLTIRANFTWREWNLGSTCGFPNEGTWELNDDNDVLLAYYTPSFAPDTTITRKMEIVDLSETMFTYQLVSNNRLVKIILKKR